MDGNACDVVNGVLEKSLLVQELADDDAGAGAHTQASPQPPPKLSTLDRFLPLWIVVAASLGLALGRVEQVHVFIESTTVRGMNVLVGLGLLAMMFPPLASVRWPLVRTALATDWRLLALSTLQNWVVGPLAMYLLAVAFFHDNAAFLAGFSLVGCARCIGMVMIWLALAGADLEYGAALIAINAVLTLGLYSLYASFLLTTLPTAMGLLDPPSTSDRIDEEALVMVDVSVQDVAINVALYMGVPFVLALGTWCVGTRVKGTTWYYDTFVPRLDALALAALLWTILLLFASQSTRLTATLVPVLTSAVPFTLYFAVLFSSTFLLARKGCHASYAQSTTLAFTATSNNYELSLGVAVATFGLDSDVAMLSVVAALVEIPTMLLLVFIARWLETRMQVERANDKIEDRRKEMPSTSFQHLASPT